MSVTISYFGSIFWLLTIIVLTHRTGSYIFTCFTVILPYFQWRFTSFQLSLTATVRWRCVSRYANS